MPSPKSFRVPPHNGVVHVVDGGLLLRRFRSDHGITAFIKRSCKAVSALVDFKTMLTKDGVQITEPGYRSLPNDYVVHWTPGKRGGPPNVTLTLEPLGLQAEIPPFHLTLTELTQITAVIRATPDESTK